MEIEKNKLEKVAGGKIIESKDGKFFPVPDNMEGFDTKEDAEKVENIFKKGPHPHGHPGMPHHHGNGHGHGPFVPEPNKILPEPANVPPNIDIKSDITDSK